MQGEKGDDIRAGQVYQNVRRPRRLWRLSVLAGDVLRLERLDNPGVVRFPDRTALTDRTRYVRVG